MKYLDNFNQFKLFESQKKPVGYMLFNKSDGRLVTLMTPYDEETKKIIEERGKYLLEDILDESVLKLIDDNIRQYLGKTKEEIDEIIQLHNKKLDFGEFDPDSSDDFSNSQVKEVVWRSGDIKYNSDQGGIWFAETKEGAELFMKSVFNRIVVAQPYYINLENPKYYETFWNDYIPLVTPNIRNKFENYVKRDVLSKKLIQEGHDGILIDTDVWNDTGDKNMVESKQYVVFDPKNVRLAKN